MHVNNKNIENMGISLLEMKSGVMIKNTNYDYYKDKINIVNDYYKGFPYEIKLLIKAESESILERNISYLRNELDNSTIFYSDLELYHDVIVLGFEIEEENYDVLENKYMAVLKVALYCHKKYGEKVEIVGDKKTTIMLEGSVETPCVLELTAGRDIDEINITGLEDDIKLYNLTKDKKIIIDGEKRTVTGDGENKFLDYNSWGFPKLKPGINEIEIDSSDVEIIIRYSPSWI